MKIDRKKQTEKERKKGRRKEGIKKIERIKRGNKTDRRINKSK